MPTLSEFWVGMQAFGVIALTGCIDAEETMSTRPDLTACRGNASVSIPATNEEGEAAVECLESSHVDSEAVELELNLVEGGPISKRSSKPSTTAESTSSVSIQAVAGDFTSNAKTSNSRTEDSHGSMTANRSTYRLALDSALPDATHRLCARKQMVGRRHRNKQRALNLTAKSLRSTDSGRSRSFRASPDIAPIEGSGAV
jgi:hypothetical protein